jgi:pantoate--beta-alanine ligase
MITLEGIDALRRQIQRWRKADDSIALVPTMGNLHPGHLKLVEVAMEMADRVVVSIFVNPMQFGEGEDFAAYPRTMEEDASSLISLGTDLLFAPALSDVYPASSDSQTRVEVPEISDIFCGTSRPGHFVGVATVVCKLFNMVQPDIAVFGEKDFQQLMVIRRMTEDLSFPIRIHGVPTVREEDGLARSSRNGYLTTGERARAPAIYRLLRQTADKVRAGDTNYERLETQAQKSLKAEGFTPDYFRVVRARDLAEPSRDDTELVILAAAYLGKARLIDNITLTR